MEMIGMLAEILEFLFILLSLVMVIYLLRHCIFTVTVLKRSKCDVNLSKSDCTPLLLYLYLLEMKIRLSVDFYVESPSLHTLKINFKL